MLMKSIFAAAALALATPVFAEGVMVVDPYARVMGATAQSGAAFMVIENHTGADDRLVKAESDVAQRVELHTHKADAQGNMQMMEVPEGFVIPANSSHALARGGDHVMFLGLTRAVKPGDLVKVTLTFEKAGDVVVEIPVDLDRKPDSAPMGGQMGGAKGGHMMHGTKAP